MSGLGDFALRCATARWPIQLAGRYFRGQALCQGARQGQVALTFDDGPDPRWTPGVLAALAEAGVHATFFCVGAAAERHPELVRRVAAEGHEIGSHLWHHRRDTVDDDARFDDELTRSVQLLSELAGQPVRHLRFPYGRHGRQQAARLAQAGVRAVHWTISSHDSRATAPESIVARLAATLRPGAIVLLHDGIADEAELQPPYVKTRDATVQALPALLALLRQRGLGAGTVAALAAQLT